MFIFILLQINLECELRTLQKYQKLAWFFGSESKSYRIYFHPSTQINKEICTHWFSVFSSTESSCAQTRLLSSGSNSYALLCSGFSDRFTEFIPIYRHGWFQNNIEGRCVTVGTSNASGTGAALNQGRAQRSGVMTMISGGRRSLTSDLPSYDCSSSSFKASITSWSVSSAHSTSSSDMMLSMIM